MYFAGLQSSRCGPVGRDEGITDRIKGRPASLALLDADQHAVKAGRTRFRNGLTGMSFEMLFMEGHAAASARQNSDHMQEPSSQAPIPLRRFVLGPREAAEETRAGSRFARAMTGKLANNSRKT